MGVSALLFLSLCGGILGMSGADICEDGIRKTCVLEENQFPSTAEEMDHLCPILMDHLICLLNFMDKCGDDMTFDATNLNKVTEYLRDMCKKDSSTHDGLLEMSGADICEDSIGKTCVPEEYPFHLPTTAEEMDHVCPTLQDFLICLVNYIEKCGEQMMYDATNLNRVIAYLRDVCNKDSSIYDDIVTNLPCIKKSVDDFDNKCNNLASKAMRAYEEHAKVNDPNYEGYYSQKNCLLVACELAYFVADIDRKCGADAKDIVLDAQRRSGHLESFCPAVNNAELLEMVQILELEMEQQVLIEEIVLSNEKA